MPEGFELRFSESTLTTTTASVTRLGHFWKFLVTNFVGKVSQIFGDFPGYFEKGHILSKNCCGQVLGRIGLLFFPTPCHTDIVTPYNFIFCWVFLYPTPPCQLKIPKVQIYLLIEMEFQFASFSLTVSHFQNRQYLKLPREWTLLNVVPPLPFVYWFGLQTWDVTGVAEQ